MLTTSETLLGQLRQTDNGLAWSKFVRLYSPLLFFWVRRTGLQEADATDLVQEVFKVLVSKLADFHYDRDKSFRNWLRTITLNIWRNHCRQFARRKESFDHCDTLDQVEAGGDPDDPFSEGEYQKQVMAQAMELIRPEFRPESWQAFVEHGVNGRPAADVARELGTTTGAVYAVRCRVIARLRSFLQGMLD